MALPPICDFGWKAPDFQLPATDGRVYGLSDIMGEKGAVIAFICNHCPYVRSVAGRISKEARALAETGIGFAAICANDATTHRDDSFEKMKEFATRHDFAFPYLHDESQAVARAYSAICTPDFFGFNADWALQYRGRLDESRMTLVEDARRDLYEAMREVAASGHGPDEQIASMGCSIKWKAA